MKPVLSNQMPLALMMQTASLTTARHIWVPFSVISQSLPLVLTDAELKLSIHFSSVYCSTCYHRPLLGKSEKSQMLCCMGTVTFMLWEWLNISNKIACVGWTVLAIKRQVGEEEDPRAHQRHGLSFWESPTWRKVLVACCSGAAHVITRAENTTWGSFWF